MSEYAQKHGFNGLNCFPIDATIFIPSFFDGGRVTMKDVHYVIENDYMVPAGLTPFAKDSHFGYNSSNLIDFVHEKFDMKNEMKSERGSGRNVFSISLEDIRHGGPDHVANKLTGNLTRH